MNGGMSQLSIGESMINLVIKKKKDGPHLILRFHSCNEMQLEDFFSPFTHFCSSLKR